MNAEKVSEFFAVTRTAESMSSSSSSSPDYIRPLHILSHVRSMRKSKEYGTHCQICYDKLSKNVMELFGEYIVARVRIRKVFPEIMDRIKDPARFDANEKNIAY